MHSITDTSLKYLYTLSFYLHISDKDLPHILNQFEKIKTQFRILVCKNSQAISIKSRLIFNVPYYRHTTQKICTH